MTLAPEAPAKLGRDIPPLIRRNTLLLAATQAFVGTGTQLVPTLGGIMIERLLGLSRSLDWPPACCTWRAC